MTTTTEESLKAVEALAKKEEALANIKVVEEFLKTTNEGKKTLDALESLTKVCTYIRSLK